MIRSGRGQVGGAFALLGLLACGRAVEPPPADYRRQTVDAVSSRLDARKARLETRQVRRLIEVKVWMQEGDGGPERVRAICWFDDRRRLVTLTYLD